MQGWGLLHICRAWPQPPADHDSSQDSRGSGASWVKLGRIGALSARQAALAAVTRLVPRPTSVKRTSHAALRVAGDTSTLVMQGIEVSPQLLSRGACTAGCADAAEPCQAWSRRWAVPGRWAVTCTWAACLPVFSILNALEAEGALVRQHDASRDQPLVPRHQNSVQHALIEEEVPHPLQGMWQQSARAQGSIMNCCLDAQALDVAKHPEDRHACHSGKRRELPTHCCAWQAARWHCGHCYKHQCSSALPLAALMIQQSGKLDQVAQEDSQPSAALPALEQPPQLVRANRTKARCREHQLLCVSPCRQLPRTT